MDTTERLQFDFSLLCTGEGNGNPLQCSCLENPRDGGAWWTAISGVTQSRTQLKRLSSSGQPEVGKMNVRVCVCVCVCGCTRCSCDSQDLRYGVWAPGQVGSVVTVHVFSCPKVCGILLSQPGIESAFCALEGRVLTTHWTSREIPEESS